MILYEGPSLLDPSVAIVAIATEDSNPKTGHMLFTWILRQDRPPEVAAYDGSDSAICGDCPFRAQMDRGVQSGNSYVESWYPRDSRTCYVRLSPEEGADEALPPSEVWRKWKTGEFVRWDSPTGTFAGAMATGWSRACGPAGGGTDWTAQYIGPLPVRIGSYGDPAAVPTRVWAELVRYARNWTGYTHFYKPRKCTACNQSSST